MRIFKPKEKSDSKSKAKAKMEQPKQKAESNVKVKTEPPKQKAESMVKAKVEPQKPQIDSHAKTDNSILSGTHLAEVLKEANNRLAEYGKAGDKIKQCVILNKIGLIYKAMKKLPEAIEAMQQSLELAEELNNLTVEATILRNLGTLYLMNNQHVKALKSHEESLRIKREIGDKIGEAESLEVLANGFEDRGEFDKAIDYTTKALFIYDTLGNSQNASRLESEVERLEEVADELFEEEFSQFQYVKSNRIHTVDIFHSSEFKEDLEI